MTVHRWLAPATLAAGLLATALNPATVGLRFDGSRADDPFALAAASNQWVGAYLDADGHSRLNASGVWRFGWTNARSGPSSIHFFAPAGTNLYRP